MYTLEDILELRRQTREFGYCNQLTDYVFAKIHKGMSPGDVLLVEEYEDNYAGTLSRTEYYLAEIEKDLEEYGVSFITLRNNIDDSRTLVHLFCIFQTDEGVVRLESYGYDDIYEYVNGRVKLVTPARSLYCSRIVEWPRWREDMTTLFTLPYGSQDRLMYWNGLFSSENTIDIHEPIDIMLVRPE